MPESRRARGANSTVVLREWVIGQRGRSLRRLTLTIALGASVAAIGARPAGAQQTTPPRSTKVQEPELLCDTTPAKVVRRTPPKPKAFAAGHRRKVVRPKAVVAKAPVVKRAPRPTVGKAAGRRVRPRAVAPRKPNCVKPAAAAVVPTPEATKALVAALPWTTPTEAMVPTISQFNLPGTIGTQSKAWALGLAGLSAFYFVGNDHSESIETTPEGPPSVVPEPATVALLATGLAALGAGAGMRNRRRRPKDDA